MDSARYAKIINGLVAIGIVVAVWFPDVVWDLSYELIHAVLELMLEALHLIFEAAEIGLDVLVEHLFETDMRSTQIIVFYIIVLVILVLAYGVYRWLRGVYRHCLDAWMARWQSFKTGVNQSFQRMGMAEKVGWLALVVLALITRIVLGF